MTIYNSGPDWISNCEMNSLLKESEILSDQYEEFRSSLTSFDWKGSKKLDDLRLLRKKIDMIQVQYWKIALDLNKEYYQYWDQIHERKNL